MRSTPLVLGIESSCDDTSVALSNGSGLIHQLVSSQTTIHEKYGGVVPELATREHLQNLSPLVSEIIKKTKISKNQIDLIAATRGPGLPNALRTGFYFGQGMALQLDIPFMGVHHHEAHLFSPFLNQKNGHWELADDHYPFIGLIVSGGHTILVIAEGLGRYQILGTTIDDAAGECFDKVAKLMGYPYPGGPHVDKLASMGNPKAYRFPRPMLHDKNFDFSFSGLKTSVRYFLRDNPGVIESDQGRCDLCASIQMAITEVLTAKTIKAALKLNCKTVSASGGVIANSGLRSSLEYHCHRHKIHFKPSPIKFCTDNAAMVASLAAAKYTKAKDGLCHLDSEILPSWPLSKIRI